MDPSPLTARATSASELKDRLEAERRGKPFLLYRDAHGVQQILALEDAGSCITLGRRATNHVALPWDGEVSRLHAVVECLNGEWTIADDGLSKNGSYVNGERLTGHHRLRSGDTLHVGRTAIAYCAPQRPESEVTGTRGDTPTVDQLSETQLRVLMALCRPFKDRGSFATPATNQEIGRELFLSVDAVKTHLRVLFRKFGIEHLPQNRKRAQLAWSAFQAGIVSPTELWTEESPSK
jgi:pSer/pThr/pTyr-binding forkhead associated (FHA) protein